MNDKLIATSVTLLESHIRHGKNIAGNLSMYLRSLIDRDIGEHRAQALGNGGEKKKPTVLTWTFPEN